MVYAYNTTMELDGMFGLYHILYLILVAILVTTSILYLRFHPFKEEKKEVWFFRTIGIILLLVDILNRSSLVYYNHIHDLPTGQWYNLFPDSWCSLCSLVFAIALIIGKKDIFLFEYTCYLGFFGGIFAIIIPTFLDTQGFWCVRSITGLIHHSIMMNVTILLFQTKRFIPKARRFYVSPIAFLITFGIGFLEINFFGYGKAMQIGEVFLANNAFSSFVTSTYFLSALECLSPFLMGLFYDKVIYHKTWKETFTIIPSKKTEAKENTAE